MGSAVLRIVGCGQRDLAVTLRAGLVCAFGFRRSATSHCIRKRSACLARVQMSVPAPAHTQRPSVLAMAHILSLSVVQYIVAFVGSAIVARALGPAGRGAYYLPLLAANTCLVFGKLGIDQANVFLYSTAGIELRRLSAQNGTVALGSGAILIAV